MTATTVSPWEYAARAFEPKAEPEPEWQTVGELAALVDHSTVQTPALDIIDEAIDWAYSTPNARLLVSMPPQEGKSSRVTKVGTLWALARHRELRIGIVSYSQPLAESFGREVRNWITNNNGDEDTLDLGLRIARDYGSAKRWQLDGHRGGVICVGIGGGLTGRPLEALVIDDPFASKDQADSAYYRDRVWDWWQSVGQARLAPGAPVTVILCMAGDTPVLLADGTEKPLRDVRPGDEVATYEGGRLATSTVVNWANQGPDDLFCIRMKSGRVVRANARHPFLTIDANGNESWLRTDQIRPGVRILTATGGSGAGSFAPMTNATCPHDARGCATPTTTKPGGHPATAHPQSMPQRVAGLISSIATDLPMMRLISSSTIRVGTAPSAGSRHLTATPEPTGTGSCASTTTTRPGRCADYSATTATLPSATGSHPQSSGLPLTTWSVTPDEVVAVDSCGREDVYDLQVDRTENFIANGLVSHNTRWHEDDLAGRLIAAEDGHRWRVINIPALADHDPAKGESDPLGREPGQWLTSARGRTEAEWEAIRIQAGSRVFNALYQGKPSPSSGNVWRRPWWRFYEQMLWTLDDEGSYRVEADEVIQSWDCSFKDTKGSDFVVGTVWARRGANVYLLDKIHKRLTFTETLTAFAALTARWPQANAKYVEDKANGTAVIDTLKSKIPGIVAITPTESKYARANAVAPFIEAGNVWMPAPQVALPDVDPDSLIDEAAGFPNAAHDDQVDSTSQALAQMLLDGTGAQAWIDYVKRKAEEGVTAAAVPSMSDRAAPAPANIEAVTPEAAPIDPVAARQAARNAAYRAHNGM